MDNTERTCLSTLCSVAGDHGFYPFVVHVGSRQYSAATGAQVIQIVSGLGDMARISFADRGGRTFAALYEPGNGADCISDYYAGKGVVTQPIADDVQTELVRRASEESLAKRQQPQAESQT